MCHAQRHILNRSFTLDGTSTTITTVDETTRHAIIMSNGPRSDSSRDSGTSSPQPNDAIVSRLSNGNSGSSINTKLSIHVHPTDLGSGTTKTTTDDDDDVDSDSNDSVFSTSSSLDEDSMHFDEQKQYEARDIYLGGSCALRTSWRRDIALPFLTEKQVTCYLPTLHENLSLKQLKRLRSSAEDNSTSGEVTGDDIGSLMYNPRILDSSRVLLFVITNETRSLAPMTLAAHYIGLGYNVVLCIQMLLDDCEIGSDKVNFAW